VDDVILPTAPAPFVPEVAITPEWEGRIRVSHMAEPSPWLTSFERASCTDHLPSAAYLEAIVNELYQDAADGHGVTGDGCFARPRNP
jgi:hypothetical protein